MYQTVVNKHIEFFCALINRTTFLSIFENPKRNSHLIRRNISRDLNDLGNGRVQSINYLFSQVSWLISDKRIVSFKDIGKCHLISLLVSTAYNVPFIQLCLNLNCHSHKFIFFVLTHSRFKKKKIPFITVKIMKIKKQIPALD